MELLNKVIELIKNKYKDINYELENKTLYLEYLFNKKNATVIALELKEYKSKIKIKIYTEKPTLLVGIDELDEILSKIMLLTSYKEIVKLFVRIKEKEQTNMDKIKEYMNSFNSDYNKFVKKSVKDMPVILQIFEQFEDEIYKTNKDYKNLQDELLEIENQVKIEFTKRQKRLFENYIDCMQKMNIETTKQAFVIGFTSSKELKEEVDKIAETRNKK